MKLSKQLSLGIITNFHCEWSRSVIRKRWWSYGGRRGFDYKGWRYVKHFLVIKVKTCRMMKIVVLDGFFTQPNFVHFLHVTLTIFLSSAVRFCSVLISTYIVISQNLVFVFDLRIWCSNRYFSFFLRCECVQNHFNSTYIYMGKLSEYHKQIFLTICLKI